LRSRERPRRVEVASTTLGDPLSLDALAGSLDWAEAVTELLSSGYSWEELLDFCAWLVPADADAVTTVLDEEGDGTEIVTDGFFPEALFSDSLGQWSPPRVQSRPNVASLPTEG
jgi:hypothetical protein